MNPRLHLLAGLVLACLALAAPASAQKLRDRNQPANAPIQCPWCRAEPELMQASGTVSHGGFEFARSSTAGVDEFYPTLDIRWIETAHFEIGLGVSSSYKIGAKERDKIRAELEQLQLVLPDVEPKTRSLDPWLRLHLIAVRAEKLYTQFLGILGVEERVFPSAGEKFMMTGKYWGEGPYLGQKGKYEVILFPSLGAHKEFLLEQFGLPVDRTQRYNVIERDSLIVVTNTALPGLRDDQAMHGHLAFNLAIQFCNGFKHYSYDLPVWLREGIGHWVERSIDPNFNSFDSAEGAVAQMTSKSNWEPPTRKLVSADKAPRMAELVAMKSFAEFELDQHYTTWSIIDYLMRTKPEAVGQLLDGLKGIVDSRGFADGSALEDAQRQLFKQIFNGSYASFDAQWRQFVMDNYSAQ